jgi:hypothetical protein
MLRFKSPPVLAGALVASFLGALLVTSPANGSIVQALDLDELVGQSDQILLGRVVFSESFQRSDGLLGSWHRIVVERDVRGSASGQREVIVETLGGSIGDVAMRVEGEPSFSVGERVLVFVREGRGGATLRPVGMGQGVMRVRVEQGVETVRQAREGLLLLRRSAKGGLERSAGALPTKEQLDSFLSRVRSLVQQTAGGANE